MELIQWDYGIYSLVNCVSSGPTLAVSTNRNSHCFGAITLPKPWTLYYNLGEGWFWVLLLFGRGGGVVCFLIGWLCGVFGVFLFCFVFLVVTF